MVVSKNKKEEASTKFSSNYMDLFLVFFVTILTNIFVITPILNESFIRTILGLLLILFIPGYSLIAFLFPKMNDLKNIERLTLSIGLSLAISPLTGLLMNYTQFGIRLIPIILFLSFMTILMTSGAYFRRKKIPENERFRIEIKKYYTGFLYFLNRNNDINKISSLILIVSIFLAVSMTVYIEASPKENEKFTEFYILGPGGQPSNYPTYLSAGKSGNVNIGVVNHEHETTSYEIVVKSNGNIIDQEKITLNDGQKRNITSSFVPTGTGNTKIEFLLYKLPDEINVYRSLHLWIYIG